MFPDPALKPTKVTDVAMQPSAARVYVVLAQAEKVSAIARQNVTTPTRWWEDRRVIPLDKHL